jgi:hypothetical protein
LAALTIKTETAALAFLAFSAVHAATAALAAGHLPLHPVGYGTAHIHKLLDVQRSARHIYRLMH